MSAGEGSGGTGGGSAAGGARDRAAGDGERLVDVCRAEELAEGESMAVRVPDPGHEAGPGEEEGRRIALFRRKGRVHAMDDRCPHAGGPLSEGTLVDGAVMCSWHCATFDLETGRSLDSISRWDADVYPVEERDGWIRVRIPEEDEP